MAALRSSTLRADDLLATEREELRGQRGGALGRLADRVDAEQCAVRIKAGSIV